MNRKKVALGLGSFVAVFHVVWAILAGLGWLEPVMTWLMGLHFVSNPFQYQPFNLVTAVVLIVVYFILGYVFGWVFATVWNWVNKK